MHAAAMTTARRLVAIWFCTLFVCACNLTMPDGREQPGGSQARRKVRIDHPGLPLPSLSEAELRRFEQGDALFEATLRESDGLGPLYVRDACAACHAGDGRGPGLVMKVAPKSGDAALAKQLLPFGSSERPYTSAGAKIALLSPSHPELMTTPRLPPAVFGRGYLDAIADADLERLEERAHARDGTARGRLNRLGNGRIGRFGLKASSVTLADFTAEALSSDMGVSSPTLPEEPSGPEGLTDDAKPGVDFTSAQVQLLVDYLRGLQIPERRAPSGKGARLFTQVRCADCHEPSFTTDPSYPIAALAGVEVDVYTDLSLHDMGQAMSDGVTEGTAGPRDFRTAPLIGLRFLPSFLHDGRAKSVEEAILAHGGSDSEGRDSVERYLALPAAARRELVSFVEGL
jgi:CxxC motif-containing protein (DUF1111 family)